MAFLEDPRFRQRWNRIAHDAETVTENAAAGIWNFQHHYITPCLGSVKDTIEQCTTVCLGDADERFRRQRERARERAEYNFNFYDDWDRAEESGGLLGTWGGEDWDRLLAGSGSQRKREIIEQPRRRSGMSYGTRGVRRKATENDPTIIPSTQPIGFLSRLPWRVGGPLRYKPSAADLQDNPGARRHRDMEARPLLGGEDGDDDSDDGGSAYDEHSQTRKRSGTAGSGNTSDSYRSRGDLFPSDGEGDEDAIALDDEVTYEMVRKDDRSSGKSGGTRSSKGKRRAGWSDSRAVSRTVSRTTLGSVASRNAAQLQRPKSLLSTDTENASSLNDVEIGEQSERECEDEELAGKRDEAATSPSLAPEPKPPEVEVEGQQLEHGHDPAQGEGDDGKTLEASGGFIPARLPQFG